MGIAMNRRRERGERRRHADPAAPDRSDDPDGTINSTLWTDVVDSRNHEMTLKTKALVEAYF